MELYEEKLVGINNYAAFMRTLQLSWILWPSLVLVPTVILSLGESKLEFYSFRLEKSDRECKRNVLPYTSSAFDEGRISGLTSTV